MNKLDELIEITRKQFMLNEFTNSNKRVIKKVAIEFAKQLLEEAAENIETVLWQNNEDLELIQNRAKYLIEDIKIKELTTSVINKYL